MTRINVIPVEELTDNFLLAEYFELPRLYSLIIKAAKRDDRKIPDTYRVGEGHMRFFYNKIPYLLSRHKQLEKEGRKRQLRLQVDAAALPMPIAELGKLPEWWWQDYIPTVQALQINRDRLAYRHRHDGGIYR